MKFKEDFGIVKVKKIDDVYALIKSYMAENGYNVNYCDICSVNRKDVIDNKEEVHFKFVHYSVPTMSTEPYYRIVFEYTV